MTRGTPRTPLAPVQGEDSAPATALARVKTSTGMSVQGQDGTLAIEGALAPQAQ